MLTKIYRVCTVCNNLYKIIGWNQKRCIRCINTQPKSKYYKRYLKTIYKLDTRWMRHLKTPKKEWLKKLHKRLNMLQYPQ